MPRLIPTVFWTGLVCLAVFITGCVKLKQIVTLMPDGSGKIELSYGLSEKLAQLDEENQEDPFQEVIPSVMRKKCRGVVAFTDPVRSKADGFSYLSYTAYFTDINQLHIGGLGEGKPAAYHYKRESNSATLTIMGGPTLSMITEYKQTPEADRAAVREAMAGLMLNEHFVLPGNVESIEGVATETNNAKLDLTLDDLLAGTGPIQALKDANKLVLKVPTLSIHDDAVNAFKQEFEETVNDWNRRQAAQEIQ